MRDRVLRFFVLAAAVLSCLSAAIAQPAGGLGQVQIPVRERLGELPDKLAGKDPHVGALAAHDLIQVIASNASSSADSRRMHLQFLMQCLEPEGLSSKAADLVSAERIVTALGTWIDDKGTSFDGVAHKVLLPLLGVGDDELRTAVIRALRVNALRERESSGESSTLLALRDRLLAQRPPGRPVIEDAAEVLWETDAKALLGTLIEALGRHERPESAEALLVTQSFLKELSDRLDLSLPSAAAWTEWWTEHQELRLEEIFARALAHVHHQHVQDWKTQMVRLRETGDAERVLLAIQHVLGNSWGSELRVAAVSELGAYAAWVRDNKVNVPTDGGDVAEFKDRLLARAVQTLSGLQLRKLLHRERPDVLSEGLDALRAYQVFLDRTPDLKRDVSEIVVAAFDELPLAVSFASNREYLLAALRLAGVLRVAEVRPVVEEILRSPDPPWAEDLEFLTTAVTTLGPLLDESSSDEWSRHLVELLREPRGPEVEEFRRACITTLDAAAQHGVKNPETIELVRSFYQELLEEGPEKSLRVPAIIGLGTLARLGDSEALNFLTDALSESGQFEPQELIAVIDSVTYVDPQLAFSRFLPRLSDQDQKVQDHLWKRTVGIVEAGGLPLLGVALVQLEKLSHQEDSQAAMQTMVRLCEEAQVRPLLLPENSAASSGERLGPFWDANLRLAYAYDQLGDDKKRDVVIARLSGLETRNSQVKEHHASGVAELDAFKRSLEQRAVLDKKLRDPGALETMDGTKDLAPLFPAELPRSAFGGNLRWFYRRLAEMEHSPALVGLVDLYASFLRSGLNEHPTWTKFSPKFQERYLSRLRTLQEEAGKAPALAPGEESGSREQ